MKIKDNKEEITVDHVGLKLEVKDRGRWIYFKFSRPFKLPQDQEEAEKEMNTNIKSYRRKYKSHEI